MSVVVAPAGRCVGGGGIDELRHDGLRDDVVCGFAFLSVAARGNEHTRMVGQMNHELAVANGVGPEAAWTVEVWQSRGVGCMTGVEVKCLVGNTRVEVKGVWLGC
jgi:hypothetical protein